MGRLFYKPSRSDLQVDRRGRKASGTRSIDLRANVPRGYTSFSAGGIMNWLKQLLSRRRLYSEVSEEIQAHLDEKIEELVAGGMSREAAGYAARREFGNVGLTEENGREAWRWPSIEDF